MHGQEILQHPEQWVAAYGDYLYRYAIFRVRDHHVAEDLVQETFLAALEARERFAGQSTVRTWLVGILNHKAVDHIRKSVRERVREDDDLAGVETFDRVGHPYVPKWEADPAAVAEDKAFQVQFTKCLSGIPPKFFEVYSLREVDNMPPEEICNALGLTPTNVRVILHRARNMLRKCLEDNWFGGNGVEVR